jgi:hypothetical protein
MPRPRRRGERRISHLSGPPLRTAPPVQTEAQHRVSFGNYFGKVCHPIEGQKAPASSLMKAVLTPSRFGQTPSAWPKTGFRRVQDHHPAAVSKTASRKACSSSVRPINPYGGKEAHLSACRERQQPAQTGSERTRSSKDFRAMPAAKAASASVTSRPFGRTHAGRPDKRKGNEEEAAGSESMPVTLHRMCGLG